ncbi:MAG: PIN domain-containing protein [Defluviitaleaceae bacterium]|nr:PIN domain-containing protein [Defluviitaleaceae bacterium]MCL2263946.1 PIN domain-containing protein [Defluviitaleaceae bacterium]
MGIVYALDANIIIHLLRQNPTTLAHRNKAWESGASIVIPPIVHFEIMRGFLYTPAYGKEMSYRIICAECPIDPVTASIWERAAFIYASTRRKGYTVHDADLLIAAYCLEGGYTLVTNNTADFENIDGLQLTDWTV